MADFKLMVHFLDFLWKGLLAIMDLILHLDQHLDHWVHFLGPWIYVLVFLIIICETGLVLTPFLPGDSLLFAMGTIISAKPLELNLGLMVGLLSLAAILGGFMNYALGHYVGRKAFSSDRPHWIKQSHLMKTQHFYEKNGGKAILLARFIPIIRTFAPFVAGIAKMNYRRFVGYNIFGALAWVPIVLSFGYFFGNVPIVRKNFGLVIPGIIILSVLPIIFERVKKTKNAKATKLN